MVGRLPAVTDAVARRIEDGTIPGGVVLVATAGEIVYLEAQGEMDLAPGRPFQSDTIYWLASLTKPIVAAAALILIDEGKLALSDEIADHLPEFAAPPKVRVWDRPPPPVMPFGPPPDDLPGFRLIPAEQPLRIEHLLTHTGGLQSITIYNPDFPWAQEGEALADYVPKLAAVPLDFQPGTRWAYSNAAGFEVLARIVEVASGQEFGEFLTERIFGPLGMTTAGFGSSVDRSRAMPVTGPLADNAAVRGSSFHSGSAGLWMSAEDYFRFADVLVRGGVAADRTRLLSHEAVREMTRNRVGDLMQALNGRAPAPGLGFGLAVATVEDGGAAGLNVPDGSFGWDGIATRRFWGSPREQRVVWMYIPDQGVQMEVEAVVAAALS
jgi:CubicO group peptidase (beta-lactamase class C family)